MLIKTFIKIFFILNFLLSGSIALADPCICPNGVSPICALGGKLRCLGDTAVCKVKGRTYYPKCPNAASSSSTSSGNYPPECLCSDSSIPPCRGRDKFFCYMNKYPLCQENNGNSYTPTCPSGESLLGAPVISNEYDGCCKSCPDSSTPSCPGDLGLSYWCVKGEPNCCKATYADKVKKVGLISLDCTPTPLIKSKLPGCFYPSVSVEDKQTLCNESTNRCPDGSPVICNSGYSFMCIKGVPDCCKGDVCTDDFDPICFYNKACSSSQSTNLNACCATCSDRTTTIMCEEPLQYWCVNGKKDCCTLPEGGIAPDDLLCSPENEEDQCPTPNTERTEKCSSISSTDKCCSFCQNGSRPKCLVGKSLWCQSNFISCCDDDGENCENAICESTFQCPSNILAAKQSKQISGNGCCKTCQNQIDAPTCPSGTSVWCVENRSRCCSSVNGKLLCLSIGSDTVPTCPKQVTRQCN